MIRAGGRAGGSRPQVGGRLSVLFLATIVGAVGGLAAGGFRYLIDLSRLLFGAIDSWRQPGSSVLIVLLPAVGGLVVGRLNRAGRSDQGPQPLDFTDPAERRDWSRHSPLRHVVSVLVTALSGGSVGGEGALGEVGAGLGATAGRWLGLTTYRLFVLSACGLAALLGGLLQAPFAGVLLAGEIVLGGYAVRSIIPLGLSAFGAALLGRYLTGGRGALLVPGFELDSPVELGAYVVVGLAAGVTALSLLVLLGRTRALFLKIPLPAWAKPALGGLLVGGIALLWPQVSGVGYASINSLLAEPPVTGALTALLFAKLAATSLSLGSGGVGSLVAPSLFAGACVGSLIGGAVGRLWPDLAAGPQAYATVGMIAVLAGTTRTPLTAIVLAADLTGNYLVLLPATIAVVGSALVVSVFRTERSPARNAVPGRLEASAPSKNPEFQSHRVLDCLQPIGDTVLPNAPLAEVRKTLQECRYAIVVVIDSASSRKVEGVVLLDSLNALPAEHSQELMPKDAIVRAPTVRDEDALATVVAAFARCQLPALPVVDSTGTLQGAVTREDVMRVCAQELLKGYPGVEDDTEEGGDHGPRLHGVGAMPVPKPFCGKTLRQVDLVRRWGVTCVGLRRATEKGEMVPLPLEGSTPLCAGDVMVLVGDRAKVERVCAMAQEKG